MNTKWIVQSGYILDIDSIGPYPYPFMKNTASQAVAEANTLNNAKL